MNATYTYFLACIDCTVAMTDPEVPVDPMVEEKFYLAGRLCMGSGRDFKCARLCDFCESETDHMIRWDRY